VLKVDRANCSLTKLDGLSRADADMKERSDLQRLIYANPEQFLQKECNEDLFVLNEEVMPSPLVGESFRVGWILGGTRRSRLGAF
jgi:hypothetical protein